MIRVGDRLLQERKRKNLSVDDVAKATKIRREFILALEKGDYKKLPSSAYIHGFIKNYIDFLGLSEQETLAMFRREFDEREILNVLPESFTRPHKPPLFRVRLGTVAIYFAFACIFTLGFIIFEYKSAFINPALTLISPKENSTFSSQTVDIKGKTDANVIVTVNDLPAFVEKNGIFNKDITLFIGHSTIVVIAVNNFRRKSTVIRHITIK